MDADVPVDGDDNPSHEATGAAYVATGILAGSKGSCLPSLDLSVDIAVRMDGRAVGSGCTHQSPTTKTRLTFFVVEAI